MKIFACACCLVLTVGVATVYRLQGEAPPPPPVRAAEPESAAAVPPAPLPQVAPAPSAPFPTPTPPARPAELPDVPVPAEARSAERAGDAEGRARDDDRPRRRRWRERDIGPIPTPAEWRPPEGPVRIALQAGHWRANEAPPELSGLRDNGTRWERVPEWQVNLDIARAAAGMLEEAGYQVDVLPAVVPPNYRAHLFIAIHADGSTNPSASGFRVSAPRRDATGRAEEIATLLERSYGEATGLKNFGAPTRRMQNYYAFNYRRYEHALHPMTIGVIIETGYLSSASDRRVIVEQPELAARGIVDAVLGYRETQLASSGDGG